MTILAIMTAHALSAESTVGQVYEINWHTIDGGGEQLSTGGGYELSGTIGQADATQASALTGGDYALTGGFWALTSPACAISVAPDFDHDCDVDGDDVDHFIACAAGPEVPLGGSGCGDVDFDGDGDGDQMDFATLQRCVSGAGIPADPGCAE